MNNVEKFFHEKQNTPDFIKKYCAYIQEILSKISAEDVSKMIDVIHTARENDKMVFFIGNGGSAATASHFANDLSIGTRSSRKPFRVMSLTDNVPVLTAIGNDFGYDDIFIKQLQAYMHKGDVVVAISASGNSPNVVKAIEWANAQGATTISLTGFDGGKIKGLTHINLHVPSNKGEYGPVEDLHMIFDHMIGAYFMYSCQAER